MHKNVSGYFLIIALFLTINTQAQLNNPNKIESDWKTDTSNRVIDLSEITVSLARNSFVVIDYPDFVGKEEGMKMFFKHEAVIAIEINGEAKAYPLNMLTMHEIINDSLGGVPILPTYCPLSNSSMVYNRKLNYNDKEYLLEFEVSGMLRNSDMVMADKQTESWWQQLTGEAIVGELAGAELSVIPSLVISVEDFFTSYPEGVILSQKTKNSLAARYGKNPYNGYDKKGNTPFERYFDLKKLDKRLDAMDRVIDVKAKDGYKIYPFSVISEKGVINDKFQDLDIVIFYKKGTVSVLDEWEIKDSRDIGSATVFSPIVKGKVLTFEKTTDGFIDTKTKSVWDITGKCISGKYEGMQLQIIPHSNHFAFAWLSFYPESEVYSE
jgi:hypothetical protein